MEHLRGGPLEFEPNFHFRCAQAQKEHTCQNLHSLRGGCRHSHGTRLALALAAWEDGCSAFGIDDVSSKKEQTLCRSHRGQFPNPYYEPHHADPSDGPTQIVDSPERKHLRAFTLLAFECCSFPDRRLCPSHWSGVDLQKHYGEKWINCIASFDFASFQFFLAEILSSSEPWIKKFKLLVLDRAERLLPPEFSWAIPDWVLYLRPFQISTLTIKTSRLASGSSDLPIKFDAAIKDKNPDWTRRFDSRVGACFLGKRAKKWGVVRSETTNPFAGRLTY